MLPLLAIFTSIALLFCAVGWAICTAAKRGDEQLDCDPPEPVVWPELQPEWEQFMDSPRCRNELRVHRRERELLPVRRGDR